MRGIVVLLAGIVFNAGAGRGQVPGFRHGIMPLLSKAGCNAGACHGSAHGKGNLKLSLRGEDPAGDFAVLTGNRESSRLRVSDPESGYLLRKPAGLAEHEGGKRFEPGSEEYRLLRDWIAAGAPADAAEVPALTALKVTPPEVVAEGAGGEVALAVWAEFSDSSRREVTRWAVYEPSNLLVKVSRDGVVRAERTGESSVVVRFEHLQVPVRTAFLPPVKMAWPEVKPVNFIDKLVFEKLQSVRLVPSELCDDVTFLRRVYYDLLGVPPRREEAEAFLKDTAPEKRARLVDALLVRPEYAEWWALKWADLLRVDERILDEKGTEVMAAWLREWMREDRPLDALARALVTGAGSTYTHAPANYYRVLREPVLRSETTAQIFLGTRLGCAKCHNHPFERWTQDDYYRFAAVFDGIGYKIVENKRKDDNDKLEFVGEQVVEVSANRELKDPRTGKEPEPGLLDGGARSIDAGPGRLEVLANWMTSPEHPLFARVMVNRLWAHLMGRGLVDPVDDFRLTNPASNPPLLDALAEQLVKDGFRQRNVLRLICNSRTYQLSAVPNVTNGEDALNFSRAVVRRLPAEAIVDGMYSALGLGMEDEKFPGLKRAGQIPGARFITKTKKPSDVERFLKEFGKPPRATSCECERVNESSLSQVFTLTGGPALHGALRKPGNVIDGLMNRKAPPGECVEALYWNALSRGPSEAEAPRLTEYVEKAKNRRAALEDVAWGLVNSKEFLLRR